VVFAASAFRYASTSASFTILEVPSGAVVDLPVRFLFEVSVGSDSTFPAGNIFLPAVGVSVGGNK
jgi:hypothetical protein